MDDKTALDLLAGDFSAPATAPATSSSSSATVTSSSSAKVCATPSDPTQPMSGKVLDSLYDSLLPDTPQFTQFKDTTKAKSKSKSRSRTKKSPAEGTVEPLPAAPSSDVTPTNKS
uniref:Uncharacterized protein n=1 Tax=Knipowitschia caucasica TaxID=637954 RepID=A0AAV2M5W6_KNICA